MHPQPAAPWSAPRSAPRAFPHRWWTGTAGAMTAAFLSMSIAIAFAASALTPDGGNAPDWLLLTWLLGLVPVGLLALRDRAPVAVCVGAAVPALVLPLDSLAALIALSWVIARRGVRTAVACGVLTATATGVALARDLLRPAEHSVLGTTDPLTGGSTAPGVVVYVVIGVLLVGASVAAGLLRRSRETTRVAVGRQQHSDRVADELRTEMTRQEERELIAREVHDTVAHQLSLVALHASTLQLDGADVRGTATSIREAAGTARGELRDLIAMLRDPAAGGAMHPAPVSLADLPAMLDRVRDAGAPVRSTIYVTDAAAASPALTRAVYRIVQESVTNAIKHAPGQEVVVDVRAAPGDGVQVRVANRRVPGAPGQVAGSGVVGMGERAELLGGSVRARPEGDLWVVDAHLPWHPTVPPRPAADVALVAPR